MIPTSPFGINGATLGVRRPTARVAISGSGGLSSALANAASIVTDDDPWAASLVSILMIAGPAPSVDALEITVGAPGRVPEVEPGDEGSVSLGYEDEGPEVVFSGMIESVRRGLGGATRIVLVNGGSALARFRTRKSYERQSSGAIVRDLAAAAGVSAGTIEDGAEFPFYTLDDRRGGWSTVAELALRNGFMARIAPSGDLEFGPGGGSPVQTFRFGEDVLALDLAERAAPVGAVTMHGEGAAGGEGQDAWGWLVKDPSTVTGDSGSGAPVRFLADASVRSADSARDAAAGFLAAANSLRVTGRLLVLGAPAVTVGSTVEASGMPDSALDGVFLVTGVRHDYDTRRGFRSRLSLVAVDDGLGSGSLGGFL